VLGYLAGWNPEGRPAGESLIRLYSELPRSGFCSSPHSCTTWQVEGHDHAVKGAFLARGILERMQIPIEEIEFVCFLIENHLLM
jgi:hypothetical protein